MFMRVTVHRGYNQPLRDVPAPPRATPLGALRRECEERARRRSRPRFGKNIMRSAAEHALQKSPPTAAQVAHIKERRPPDLLMLCASKALARTRAAGRREGMATARCVTNRAAPKGQSGLRTPLKLKKVRGPLWFGTSACLPCLNRDRFS